MVARRVDWLTVAFRMELDRSTVDPLLVALGRAGEAGRVQVELAGSVWCMSGMRAKDRYRFENLTCTAILDMKAAEGWSISVDFPGSSIANLDPFRAVEIARELAGSLGKVIGERCRRLDLAVDVAGVDTNEIEAEAFVKPRRARLGQLDAGALEKGDAERITSFRRGRNLTGFHLCPGGAIQLVVYDKREELTVRPEKAPEEQERWTLGGWDGESPVARFEFRLRAEALNELHRPDGRGLRDGADQALRHLDRIWGYCCEWVRLVDVDKNEQRMARRAIDERWEVVRSVRWLDGQPPAIRKRTRRGASVAQVWGASISMLGGAAELPDLVLTKTDAETGEVFEWQSEAEMIASMPEETQELALSWMVATVMGRAETRVRAELVERFGGVSGAATFALYRIRATWARFQEVQAKEVQP